MDLFTYRDKISQPLTACKRNPGVCAYTQTVKKFIFLAAFADFAMIHL